MIPKICAVMLFIYALINLLMHEINIALFCFIVGIMLFYVGIRSENNLKPKQKPTAPQVPPTPIAPPQQTPTQATNTPQQQAVPPMPQDKPKPLWETAGLSKPTKTLTIKVAGVTFECRFSNTYNDRQDVLSTVKDGDRVRFHQYSYQGRPAIALIHELTDSDIGVVPADLTEKVLGYLNQYDVVGLIKDSDWFTPRKEDNNDDDEDFDDFDFSMESEDEEDEEIIYISKVLLCAYKRNSEKQ